MQNEITDKILEIISSYRTVHKFTKIDDNKILWESDLDKCFICRTHNSQTLLEHVYDYSGYPKIFKGMFLAEIDNSFFPENIVVDKLILNNGKIEITTKIAKNTEWLLLVRTLKYNEDDFESRYNAAIADGWIKSSDFVTRHVSNVGSEYKETSVVLTKPKTIGK